MKALDDSKIEEVQKRRQNGERIKPLALEYNVHYRTIENYCRELRRNSFKRTTMKRFMAVR